MKTRRLTLMVVASFVILALMAMVPEPVAAFHESKTDTVQDGEFIYFSSSDLGSGSSGWSVTYSVSDGSSDPYFDAFLMTSSEFSNFQGGSQFTYIIDCSVQNTHSIVSKTCSPATGSYVLVFDNSNQGYAKPNGYSATFTYTVDTSGGSTGSTDFLTAFGIMCVLIVVIIVVVIIAVIVVIVRRRSQPVQPAYNPPPQQPYYQQPQPMYQPPPPPMDPYQQQYQQPPPPPYGGGPGYGSPPPPYR